MDLPNLKLFFTVVREGSFAKAARVLKEDPSRISRQIQALEKSIGVRLFHRTTRTLTVTDSGLLLYSEIQPILEAMDNAVSKVRDSENQISGTIRMSAPVSFTLTNVLPGLIRFLEMHPAITLDLHLHDATPDFSRDHYDLAITLGLPPDSDAIAVPLAGMRNHVCASVAYLARHGRPATPLALATCNCLILDMPGFDAVWRFTGAGSLETLEVPVHGSLVTSNALALKQAAIAGLGVAMLAEWMIHEELGSGTLIDLFPERVATCASYTNPTMWLLHAPRAFTARRVSILANFLRDFHNDQFLVHIK